MNAISFLAIALDFFFLLFLLFFLWGEGREAGRGEEHHCSLARQRVPNEIHLFKTLYIITLSGPPRGTPTPSWFVSD